MKVIYIADNFLDNNSGGSLGNRAFVNAFSEIADSSLLLYPDKGQNLRNYIHKKTIIKGISNKKSKLKKIIDIYSGNINWYTSSVLTEIKSYNPDIVVFDGSRSSVGLLKNIKALGIKVITIHHNYEIEYFKGSPPSILWRIPFMHFMKKAESEAVKNSDLNLTVTDQDTELLRMNYDPEGKAKIKKLGNFESIPSSYLYNENTNSQSITNNSYENNLKLVITGSLNSYQTEVSVIPFIKYIYPLLIKKLPNSQLIIAGRDPSIKLKAVCAQYSSIKLIPNPDNMQVVIDMANLYVCPISIGGGRKLRVMDGLKSGLPVLTHEVSARGYDEFKKAGFLFAYEDQNSFIESLDLLLSERSKGKLEKEKIKELYNSIFSFESGVRRLKEILNKL